MRFRTRTVPLLGILLSLLLPAAACVDVPDQVNDLNRWLVVQSPVTEECYETFQYGGTHLIMSPIDCSFLEKVLGSGE